MMRPGPHRREVLLAALLIPASAGALRPERTGLGAFAVTDTAHAIALDEPAVLRLGPDGRPLARTVLSQAPTGLAVARAEGRVIATATGVNRAWSADALSLGDLRELRTAFSPDLLSIAPEGGVVAIAAIGAGEVALLDVVTLETVAWAKGLTGAHDLRWDTEGERLFVSTLDGARIAALDGRTLAPLGEIALPAPTGIDHMSRTPAGDLGLAVSPGDPVLRLLDLDGVPEPTVEIALASPPVRAMVDERGRASWLASHGRAEIYRVDLRSLNPLTIPLNAPVRTITFEPFSDGVLAVGDRLTRLTADGRVLEGAPAPAPLAAALPLPSAGATLLLDRDGGLWRQEFHRPLDPTRLPAPALYRMTGAHALAFCHG